MGPALDSGQGVPGRGAAGRRTFATMGTTVSVLPGSEQDPGLLDAAVARIRTVFEAADQRFSLYRPDSELSRVASGGLALPLASAELRQMYGLAVGWRNATGGAFNPHRGDGTVDLSGIVKGWALAAAGDSLTAAGLADWSINAGGDVLCRGRHGAVPWTVGIVDPADRTALLASVQLPPAMTAVATSGSAERGDHIWTHSFAGERQYRQVTVVGPDIITADVLATAVVAGGRTAFRQAAAGWPVEILAVETGGELLATPGFRALLAPPPERGDP